MTEKTMQKAIDYSGQQKDAAYSVLGEIVNLLNGFEDDIRLVGGWVPALLYPDKEHIGSIDVDILLNQEKIKRTKGYETIRRLLLKNNYRPHPAKYFKYIKTVVIDGSPIDVEVDFLAGKYGGEDGNVSKHVDGIKALPATGGNFAFDFPAEEVKIEYRRSDGAKDIGHVRVISVIPFLVMKTAALGRGKAKDAYDIYFCLKNYPGGIHALAEAFQPYRDRKMIKETCQKLSEKFASPEHAGPADIVMFLDISDVEEAARIRQDVYQRVKRLIQEIGG